MRHYITMPLSLVPRLLQEPGNEAICICHCNRKHSGSLQVMKYPDQSYLVARYNYVIRVMRPGEISS